MAGLIVGFFGYQRSGKTLLAYLMAESYRNRGIEVYSNMIVPEWNKISSLDEIPEDKKPKVLVLDEIYYFLDSRTWNSNTGATIFINTIGKRNILLLMTAIKPDMIEMRLREQMNYMVMAMGTESHIKYKMLDIIKNKSAMYTLEKTKELFQGIKYKTLDVPDFVDITFTKKSKIKKGVKEL
jgi:hypothetical protein